MLSAFFSRKPKKDTPPKSGSPTLERTEVPYDPGLVATLTLQHRALVTLLDQARIAAQQKRFEEVKTVLLQFKRDLNDHLKQEGTALHPYLAMHLKGEGSKDILKDMRANSFQVERTVEAFISHYGGYPVNERNATQFDSEIEGVTEEFSQRMEREEASLYTLYMTPNSY